MRFPIAVNYKNNKSSDIDIISQVFPTKQDDVQKIIDYARTSNSIDKIKIFGSAITWQCRVDSDIDIAVWVNGSNKEFANILKHLSQTLRSDFDLLNYSEITNTYLKADIDKKGVTVYDRLN